MASDSVLRRVFQKQNLINDREYTRAGKIATVLSYIGLNNSKADAPSVDRERRALDRFRKSVGVSRLGKSYVIRLAVTSRNPEKSARLAKAIAETYLSTDVDAKASDARLASSALSSRLDELRKNVREADLRIEAFKRENNIDIAQGQLVNEQQLNEVNSALTRARSNLADAQARNELVQSALRNGSVESIPAAIASQTIQQLRSQYAAIARVEASLAAVLLPSHPRLRQIRQESNSLSRQIRGELNRIAASAQNAVNIASRQTKSYEAELERLKRLANTTNTSRIRLAELEQEATASRQVLKTFLARSKETGEQQQLVRADARVVSPARVPIEPSKPKSLLILALSIAAGFAAGVMWALLAEHLSTTNVTSAHVHPSGPEPSRLPTPTTTRPRMRKPGRLNLAPGETFFTDPEPTRTRETQTSAERPSLRIEPADLEVPPADVEIKERKPSRARPHSEDLTNIVQVQPAYAGASRTGSATAFATLPGASAGLALAEPPRQRPQTAPVIDLHPPGINRRPAAVPRPDLEIIAEIDALQMRNRELSTPVLDAPASSDAQPFMSIMRNCRMQRGIRKSLAILVVAPERHKGSAHVALNLASAAVMQNEPVLLIDADTRARRLSRVLCPAARTGFSELARGVARKDQVIWHDPKTFDLLPASPRVSSRVVRNRMVDAHMREAFEEARKGYGIIVIDGGTIDRSSPAVSAAAAADRILLVVVGHRDDSNIHVTLPDQIKLQGSKLLGAIALIENAD